MRHSCALLISIFSKLKNNAMINGFKRQKVVGDVDKNTMNKIYLIC